MGKPSSLERSRFATRCGSPIHVSTSSVICVHGLLVPHWFLGSVRRGRRPIASIGSRIGPLYTPPQKRGHGHAAITAASRLLLERGVRTVLLFTDTTNLTSNAMCKCIGFVPMGCHLHLKRASTAKRRMLMKPFAVGRLNRAVRCATTGTLVDRRRPTVTPVKDLACRDSQPDTNVTTCLSLPLGTSG